MTILKTLNLSKVYPGTEPVVAVDKVNLMLEKGEHIAIVGNSGPVSPLFFICLGVDKPTEGQIFIQEWTLPL